MYLFPSKKYKHPNHEQLYIQKRNLPVLPKFRTYDFSDTLDFNGCIFDTKIEHTDELENHARLIMIHFSSYRKLEDLQKEGSYLKSFKIFGNLRDINFIQISIRYFNLFKIQETIIVFRYKKRNYLRRQQNIMIQMKIIS